MPHSMLFLFSCLAMLVLAKIVLGFKLPIPFWKKKRFRMLKKKIKQKLTRA